MEDILRRSGSSTGGFGCCSDGGRSGARDARSSAGVGLSSQPGHRCSVEMGVWACEQRGDRGLGSLNLQS